MSASKIASRYAKSLLDLAIEKEQLPAINQDMETLQSALSNRDLYLLFKSPIVNSSKKLAIIKNVFGDKLSNVTASFLDIIVKKRRESHLPEIVSAFANQYKAYKKTAVAELVTAVPVTDALLDKVRAIVKADTGNDQVELETSVDPELLGGFILRFDNKLYDTSVAHKLGKLKKQFSENKYVRNF